MLLLADELLRRRGRLLLLLLQRGRRLIGVHVDGGFSYFFGMGWCGYRCRMCYVTLFFELDFFVFVVSEAETTLHFTGLVWIFRVVVQTNTVFE